MFRQIASHLLHSVIRKQFAKTVAATPAATGDAGDPSPPYVPPTCEFAVICAAEREVMGLIDRMRNVRSIQAAGFQLSSGLLAGKSIVVAVCPVDGDVTQATEAVITGHDPKLVLAMGFADALIATAAANDLVVANRIIDTKKNGVTIDVAEVTTKGCHTGTLLSIIDLPNSPHERTELAKSHEALSAGRIALPVAVACGRRQVPMMAVYVITRQLNDQLPAEADHLFKQKSWAGRAGALLGGVTRRPATATDLWKLQENLWQARGRLADFAEDMAKR